MVCRTSLALELPPAQVALAQKLLTAKAQAAGRFVLVHGQLLDSMLQQAEPTAAERADIAGAVLDGVDGLVLGAVVSHGRTPVEVSCGGDKQLSADIRCRFCGWSMSWAG